MRKSKISYFFHWTFTSYLKCLSETLSEIIEANIKLNIMLYMLLGILLYIFCFNLRIPSPILGISVSKNFPEQCFT